MEKFEVLRALSEIIDFIDRSEGNEDALNKATSHIEKALELIDKYVIEEE